ncbi:hypothetical protein HanXRQr2_Chr14g0645521 [Helianthus annuus]|uniref:Uncharacterized protein n=1 Tax=Helianthus annuus TaxID=4232 RepID=A0A251SLC4_HELAN|nr:hypothetical protein HanXRQr2_Chr14g0645521 [Helianthus annuus]KAJ0464278.1 hypothetical protein HanHA300_Chr14g0525331 [Helianthus annuus]KAJ0485850.1 hypothetical protein HanHA89_Chr14g0573051 [Helianthus annuus]KAJ0656403.1 hypothetical protein HanLR1_Chr14g0535451 [Helianthus annuus]KAJ0660033.1 hypothetical protein HanOQP8_Chr14g0533091 [Helianthus annuus]
MWWRWSRDGGGGRRRCWPTTVTKTANNKLECYLVASGSSPIRLESRLVRVRYRFVWVLFEFRFGSGLLHSVQL